MTPLRVLMLNDYGSPDGGAERQMLRLRDRFRAAGHDVRLLASDAPLPGVAADRQSPSRADHACRGRNDRLQVLTSLHNASAVRTLRSALATFRPDVVHVRMFLWQLSPAVLPLLRSVPTLYHAAQYKSVCPTGQKRLPDGRACTVPAGRVCRSAGCVSTLSFLPAMAQLRAFRRGRDALDRVVVLSRAMEGVLRSGGFTGPVDVVHNGVPERLPRPPLVGPPTAAFAGRLVPEKGVDLLLRAFADARGRVPDARLCVVGDGPQRASLRRLAAELGVADAVTFCGHLPRGEMETRLDAAWVQATPSQWEEPFGNVSLEAMMRGTAVVAGRIGGQAEIVADGQTGYLVPPADRGAWARQLTRILSDPDHAEALGAAARARALGVFSETAVGERLLGIYRELAAPRVPALAPEPALAPHS